MPTFLYRVEPTRVEMVSEGPTPEEADAVGRHFAYLKDLTERGVVLLAGRTLTTGPETFGIVVFRAESENDARALMEGDPAVRAGVMRTTLFPFGIALISEAITSP